MVDVQISVTDLMTAFSTEIAQLSQRAILAEQKSKAWQARAEELETALGQAFDEQLQQGRERDLIMEVDPVEAVKDATPVKRAAPRKR